MAHRPCGLLCRAGARGMLLGDVLGLPHMPWVLAEPVGKAALKLSKEIAEEKKKAKRKAKRSGGDQEAAAAAVLRRRVWLLLPSTEEIKATWRQIAKAAASPPAPEPLPAPEPPRAPEPPPARTEAPRTHAAAPLKVRRLQGSRLAQDAVFGAERCEYAQVWLRDGVDTPIGHRCAHELRSTQRVHYKNYLECLSALEEAFPMKVCCPDFVTGECTHGIPCECGGTQAPWPWIVQHPTASRFCDCHMAMRSDWLDPEIAAERARNGDTPTTGKALLEAITGLESRWRPE